MQVWYDNCSISDFELGKTLGAGSFGRVSVARHVKSNHVCAAKSLCKASIIKSKQVRQFLPIAFKVFLKDSFEEIRGLF